MTRAIAVALSVAPKVAVIASRCAVFPGFTASRIAVDVLDRAIDACNSFKFSSSVQLELFLSL